MTTESWIQIIFYFSSVHVRWIAAVSQDQGGGGEKKKKRGRRRAAKVTDHSGLLWAKEGNEQRSQHRNTKLVDTLHGPGSSLSKRMYSSGHVVWKRRHLEPTFILLWCAWYKQECFRSEMRIYLYFGIMQWSMHKLVLVHLEDRQAILLTYSQFCIFPVLKDTSNAFLCFACLNTFHSSWIIQITQ